MICRENGTRFKYYDNWDKSKNSPYNYSKNGLIKHLLSPVIVNSKNKFLQYILYYYEESIIYVLKYIDRLKHFKNYHWKNR